MAGGSAQRLRLRLFLEGVEVPVIAATVQCTPNSPAVASIQIPPLPDGTGFLPRTLVHLFFLDPSEVATTHVSRRGASAPTPVKDPEGYERSLPQLPDPDVFDADGYTNLLNGRYKLLFGGEVVGFQWTKSANSRSLVLQCQDWSNYWDYAFQWNNTDLFGPGIKALFSGGSTNLFTDFMETEGQGIIKILLQPSTRYPGMKGLLGGIVHLLEAIGGSYYEGKKYSGQNIFFSLAELRLRITQMITAYEADPTASRLLNADGYESLFGRTLGGLGQQVSFRQAINALMALIFHETYAIPTPCYVPGTGGTISGSSRRLLRNVAAYKGIAEAAQELIEGLASVARAVSQLVEDAGDEAVTIPNEISPALKNIRQACVNVAGTIRDKQVLPVKRLFLAAATSVTRAIQVVKKDLQVKASSPALKNLYKYISQAQEPLESVRKFQIVTTAKNAVPARLNQQIFRPDVWFSAPPRCNVLFPEHYSQLSYQRMFMQEPTRLLLKTNDEFFGEDELFDLFYFAPKQTTVQKSKRDLSALLSNDLLDHELFTGILPVFEKMGELNIFGARSGTLRSGKMPKIGLAQRTTNFLYFKYRFAARQMTITGRFNPYIAPGFPGLIIDKHIDLVSARRRLEMIAQYGGQTPETEKLLGTHFLGNFTEVTHTVDSNGNGRTDINLSYPRQTREAVEFLGADKDQTIRKRYPTDALRSTDVAALNPPAEGSLGPNYGVITRVTDVTTAYESAGFGDLSSAKKLPLYQGPRRTGTGEPRIYVPVGLVAAASEYGPDVANLIGDRSRLVQFHAYRLEEEVPRYRREIVDLPAEEYIRPGWYGDCWHPSAIGKVYEQFFQTGAITDPQQVSDPGGASTGVQSKDAEDVLAEAANGVNFEDPRSLAPALLTLDEGSSIDQAVGFLVEVYSYIKNGGVDVDDFIQSYTWRPIASMVDMFGTQDLVLSEDGSEVVQGVEGFHSRAFGNRDDLFGLVTSDIENILGIKKGSTVAQRGDVRGRRRKAVLDYLTAIQFARAVVG